MCPHIEILCNVLFPIITLRQDLEMIYLQKRLDIVGTVHQRLVMDEMTTRQDEYLEDSKRKRKKMLKGIKDHSRHLKKSGVSREKIQVVEMKNKVHL